MKILLVSPLFPYPIDGGMKQRIHAILKALSRKHDVTLLCYHRENEDLNRPEVGGLCRGVTGVPLASCRRYQTGKPPSKLRRFLDALIDPEPALISQWYSPEMASALAQLISKGAFDVVWVERLYMTAMLPERPVTTVVDMDDLESSVHQRRMATLPWGFTRALGILESMKLVRSERRALGRHTVVTLASEKDVRAMKKERVFALPNTISVPPPRSAGAEAREISDDLFFFGLMRYHPNVDAVNYFVAEIWPRIKAARPGARFWIAGADPPPAIRQLHDGQSIRVIGYVADLSAQLEACGIVVVPLRIGGGTRIKILEAMAMSKAVVSTSIGCEGLDVTDGRHLLVADRPELFSKLCLDLMGDPERRIALGRAARQRVEERYRSDFVPEIIDHILEAAVGAGRT